MRILMISQWFEPEPSFKGLAFAKALTERGHEVQVLTGFPNYPGGKLYDGYRIHALQREMMDGVSVLRVPLYPSHDNSGLRRAANYVSFALSAGIIGAPLVRAADVAYVYHPPATAGLPAMMVRLLRGTPFVFDIQDLWPDAIPATGMFNNRTGLALVDMWCRLVYRCASRMVVLSPGFKRTLAERGVPEDKIDVIYNWCNDAIGPEPRDESLAERLGLSGRFNVVFAGTMGKSQALDAVLDAASIVAERSHAVQFVFVGGGIEVDRLSGKAQEMRLENVRFLPRMPRSEIGKLLALADVVLVHLRDHPLFRITIPSKTQGYMAAGRPILMAVRGDAADLVQEANAGLVCEPENAESIADAVCRFQAMPAEQRGAMGRSGREFHESRLSMPVGVAKFEACFETAMASRKRRT